MPNTVKVFISYAHDDRTTYLDPLMRQLAILRRSPLVHDVWTDLILKPGEHWSEEIVAALQAADLIILLISPNFIHSEFCYSKEMTVALEREGKTAVVVPIYAEYIDWDRAPFAKLQRLPAGAAPVSAVSRQKRPKIYAEIAGALAQRVEGISARKQGASPPQSPPPQPQPSPASAGNTAEGLPGGFPEKLASAVGTDPYGRWVEFTLPGENGRPLVSQRLRWIPPGNFLMGSPEDERERFDDKGPCHPVTLSRGFWLMDTACPQALWQAVMANNPSHFQGPELPVEMVSWQDVQQFLERINGRLPGLALTLPTEAQWEYACRAGAETPFSFGATITPEQVNYNGNCPYLGSAKGVYRERTVPVAALPPNPWGLYQMHGNVWEWCLDGLRPYTAEPRTDPIGPLKAVAVRALRGGSWIDGAQDARAAYRGGDAPGTCDSNYGFRCSRVQS